MEKREFHLGDILSITTERLLSPSHMGGIYDILNFMTGDDLYTHALPRAADECKPYLFEQLPWTKNVQQSEIEGINKDNFESRLAELVVKYGEKHWVSPIHAEDHEVKNPYQELLDMGVMPKKIIVLDPNGEEDESTLGGQ